MLRVFLKHKIYEYCINLIFDAVSRNFTRPNVNGIRVGAVFTRIKVHDFFSGDGHNYTYYDVRLIKHEEVIFMGEKIHHYKFADIHDNHIIDSIFGEVVDFLKLNV